MGAGVRVSADGSKIKVLTVGAHPDDPEIYCFGSLMAWRAMGAQVSLVIATDGAAGGSGDKGVLRLLRRAEAEEGAAALGAVPHFLDFPDGGLVCDRSLIDAVGKIIARERPNLVITHAPNDYHPDHRVLAAAVAQAVGGGFPVLHTDTLSGGGFTPTHYVDVTAHFETKCAAILKHQTQRPARFVASATRLATLRAEECDCDFHVRAEAFRFKPQGFQSDISALLPAAPTPRLQKARRQSG